MGGAHSNVTQLPYWLGCDPGGDKNFGVAKLFQNGEYECRTLSSVEEVLKYVAFAPLGVGVDCPLWWSTGKGGGRKADKWIRQNYGFSGGEVQSINSLRGAVLVQGVLLAMELRKRFPNVMITECHPKPLLKIFGVMGVETFLQIQQLNLAFELAGTCNNQHERDAVVSAVAAREGQLQRWKLDLSLTRYDTELDPKLMWFGPVNYWWPDFK
jgi:hypothetical protein